MAASLPTRARHSVDRLVLASTGHDKRHCISDVEAATLRLTLDEVGDAMVITDAKGRIKYVNSAFARLTDAEPDSLHATDLSVIHWIAAALSTTPDLHPWRRAMDTAHPWSVDALDFVPPQGDTARLAIRCVPILAGTGGVQGCIVTFSDCTASLAAAERERAAQVELSVCREVKRAERHDLLTGCLTRLAYFERMTQARLDAVRNRRPLSCIALRVDAIANIRARYGEAATNRLLQAIGGTLRAATRRSDIVGRCGDDEFLIGLPGNCLDVAQVLSDKLRRAVEACILVATSDLPDLHPSIHLGAAVMHDGDDELTHLIERADLALDAARKAATVRTPSLEGSAASSGCSRAS